MNLFLCLVGMCAAHVSFAQRIIFQPTLGDSALVLGRSYILPDGTPVTIERFRFYIGRFACSGGGEAIVLDTSYHLVDAEEPLSFQVDVPATARACDSLVFALGIDSLTSVAGALGGDLDPRKGMYWAWNSGYINLQVEGHSPRSPYPRRAFQLHLGGYVPPYSAMRRIALATGGAGAWTVRADLVPLLMAADVRTRCDVMSPGARAMALSDAAAYLFSIHVPR